MTKISFGVLFVCSTLVLSVYSAPPASWKEHWFEHNQTVQRVFMDNDVAVYYDKDVASTITWPFKYLGDVWRYTKRTYGNFGPENNLHAIFHSGKYGGGHPSTYFDASHDNRNVIDVGTNSQDGWKSGEGNDLDLTTHEVAHIVEGASHNVQDSPAFLIWGDSKWAEIFNYDVYLGLGRMADATRWYNLCMNTRDSYPRQNTAWFRDWFYPIYNNHGKSATLNKFFVLLSQYFPKNGPKYSRRMNWGEFVHFWSGAAGTNLQQQATTAFGWTNQMDVEFKQAQRDFPTIRY